MKKAFIFLLVSILTSTLSAQSDFHQWAKTPPMGWNSWDCYYSSVTEQQVRNNAEYMRDYLKDYGWEYVVVDIRWFTDDKNSYYNQSNPVYTMDEYGRYMPDTKRFPSAADGNGFKKLADDIHAMGLKFGIHIMRGVPKQAVIKKLPILDSEYKCNQIYNTDSLCTWLSDNYTVDCRKPGAQDYYNSIFKLYAEWGVDFIKIDDLSRPYHDGEIGLIRNAIDQCGRPIVMSMSPGATPLNKWESCQQHANMWRMMDDLWDKWSDIAAVFRLAENWNQYRIEGSYPDCDMLPLGKIAMNNNGGKGRFSNLTENEQYTMMNLWSIFKSPLMFGGDMTYNTEFTKGLMTNADVINIDQNSVNNRLVSNNGSGVIWTADEPDSKVKYAAMFNLSSSDNWIRANEALFSTETISLLTTGFGQQVEVDIPAGSKVLSLVADDSGDNFNYDHADWVNIWIRLENGDSVRLTQSDVIRQDVSRTYYKRVNWNKNINSGTLRINGKAYSNGFSYESNGILVFKLPQGAVHFSGFCGIDDTGRTQSGATSSIKFMVFNEDPTYRSVCNPAHAVANSDLVSGKFQAEGTNIEADITGAQKLYLVVTDAGDGYSYDHADWINPTLIDADGNETKLTSFPYESSKTSWKDISNYGQNVDGGALIVNGQEYADGIGTNASSIITYALPPSHPFVKFRSFVGYDEGVKKNINNGVTMEFLVFTSDPTATDSLKLALDLSSLGIPAGEKCEITDLWTKESLGTFSGSQYIATLASHASQMLKIVPTGEMDAISALPSDQKPSMNSAKTNNSFPDGIYSLQGKRIASTDTALPHGVYLQSANHHIKKIAK